MCVLAVLIGACASTGATPATPASSKSQTGQQVQIPGIPARPDVVAVVPFYAKENETDLEKTKAVIQAEVDGIRGVFIIDTGDFDVDLNRTYLQPSPTGGVDSVTDANRIPEQGWDTVRVKLRIGTLVDDFDAPDMRPNPHHGNAVLDHVFGNFSWVFAPRLGNIGVPALEPFETIIDYPHQRVIFIRLDSAGRRLAAVPAYPPASVVPLVRMSDGVHWGIQARLGGTVETLLVDTGNPGTPEEQKVADQLKQALAAGHTVFDIDHQYPNGLGFPFLRQLGVVGFNFRAKQLILYTNPAA